MDIVVADIGGTNARFALATVNGAGRPSIGEVVRFPASDYPGIEDAWRAFAERMGKPLPDRGAFAVAAPLRGDVLRFTNSPWTIDRRTVAATLGFTDLLLINDFGAVAHAVNVLAADELVHVCGPDVALPRSGTVSVIGPGTGLGIAIIGYGGDAPLIMETEGGHVHFAPVDAFEEILAERIGQRHGRVSTERVASGMALADIAATLANIEGVIAPVADDAALWRRALSGEDALLGRAVDRFCLLLGSIAGDLALAHGASGMALAGGIGPRLLDRLRGGGFHRRFTDKGRYVDYMSSIPVRMITHPEPGLLGAATAYARARASG